MTNQRGYQIGLGMGIVGLGLIILSQEITIRQQRKRIKELKVVSLELVNDGLELLKKNNTTSDFDPVKEAEFLLDVGAKQEYIRKTIKEIEEEA